MYAVSLFIDCVFPFIEPFIQLPEYSEYDKIEQYSNDLPITHVSH